MPVTVSRDSFNVRKAAATRVMGRLALSLLLIVCCHHSIMSLNSSTRVCVLLKIAHRVLDMLGKLSITH